MSWPKTTSEAGDGEGQERERDQDEGAAAALPEGPAVGGQVAGAAQAFHEGGDDAGGAGEADEAARTRARVVWGVSGEVSEVAVEEGDDVGGRTGRRSRRAGSGGGLFRQQRDDGGGDDQRGKERDHGGVGGGLREVEAVVLRACGSDGALEQDG